MSRGYKLNKKSIIKKYFVIMSLLFISNINTLVTAEQDKYVTEPITEYNYKEWSSPNLEDALVASTKFLSVNLANNKWTEGSMSALASVIDIAQKVKDPGVLSDLVREQLIQTIRKLEKKDNSKVQGSFILGSNYASDKQEYTVNYKIKDESHIGEKEIKYDIVFLLDWSGSMDRGVGYIINSRLHARDMILGMARKLLKETGTRIRLIGANTEKSNDLTAGNTGRPSSKSSIQVDTGYFDKTSDYESIISNTFNESPQFFSDNIPLSIKEVTNLMWLEARMGAIPYLFVFSDFQLKFSEKDVRGNYISELNRYKFFLNQKTAEDPIYYGINYIHTPDISFPEKNNNIFKTPGWGYQEITKENSLSAISNFTDLIEEQLKYRKWQVMVESYEFDYVYNSFVSTTSDGVMYDYPPNFGFVGPRITEGNGKYSIKFNSKVYDNKQFKKGNTVPYFKQAHIYQQDSGELSFFKQNPQLFVPVTDLAIELLEYKGEGDVTDPKNYISLKCIVSDQYNPYGGNGYSLTSDKLASIDYGETITKESILSILREKIGETEYNYHNFSDSNNPTLKNLKASFDSSKNVYKVYSIVKNKVVIDQKNIDNISGKNFIGDNIETTITGTVESQFDLKEGKLKVSIPKEYKKPKKVCVNNNIGNIDDYYTLDKLTGEQVIEVPNLTLMKNESITLKYISEINDSNDNDQLTTVTAFSGNNRANLFSTVTNQSNINIDDKPVVRVRYVDQVGNPIYFDKEKPIKDKMIEGKIGEIYDVSSSEYALEIEGYELDKEQIPANTKGVFKKKEIKVFYVYRKINKINQTKGSYKNQLSLTWVPKSFQLGKRRAFLLNNVFELNNKGDQWIVVNEDREKNSPNFGKTWQVKAKMENLRSKDNRIIEGAQFYFDINAVKEYHIGNQTNALGTDIVPNNPNETNVITEFTSLPMYIKLGGETFDSEKSIVKLKSNGEEEIVIEQNQDIPKGEATGYAIQIEKQRLIVPKVKEEDFDKAFSSSIVWTLSRDITY